MACFITPLVVGVVTSVLPKIWRKAEELKLRMLSCLLLGGSALLMIEHA